MPEEKESPIVSGLNRLAVQKVPGGNGMPELERSRETKAEYLWGLWGDYKRIEADIRRKAIGGSKYNGPLGKQWEGWVAAQRKSDEAKRNYQTSPNETNKGVYTGAFGEAWKAKQAFERGVLQMTMKDPTATEIIRRIQTYWNEPQTQEAFKRGLREHERQFKNRPVDLLGYREAKRKLLGTRGELYELLSQKFNDSELAPTIIRIKIEEVMVAAAAGEKELEKIEYPEELTREKTDLAAWAKYEELRDYQRQLEKSHFIWSPSRVKILEKIMGNLANGVWTMLKGEAGSGKTQLARTAARLLQGGQPALEVVGRELTAAKGLVGVQGIKDNKDYWIFGKLMQAVTGCKDSLEMKRVMDEIAAGVKRKVKGAICFIDEANIFASGVLEGPVKAVAGRRAGEEFNTDDLPGVDLRTADEGTGMIVAINPADARYDNRKEFPPSLERLFKAGRIDVDYPKVKIGEVDRSTGTQINDMELFDMYLAALMTREGRILISPNQIMPAYEEHLDRAANKVKRTINLERNDMEKHGALFRFALLTTAVNDSFSHLPVKLPGETDPLTAAEELQFTVLDMGTIMAWMREIQGVPNVDLQKYFWGKLKHFVDGIDTQRSEDKKVFGKLAAAWGFDLNKEPEVRAATKYDRVLTPLEIGYLSPGVQRPELRQGEELGPKYKTVYDVDSTKPPREVDGNPVEIRTNSGGAIGMIVENASYGLSGKRYYFVGRDAESGLMIFSEAEGLLQNCKYLTVETAGKLAELGQLKMYVS